MLIKKSDLKVILLSFLLVHISLVTRISNIANYTRFQWICVLLIGCVVFLYNFKNAFSKKECGITTLLLIFGGCAFFSSYINRSYNQLLLGIFNTIMILEIFFCFQYFFKIGKTRIAIKTLYICTTAYCVINDVLMIIMPDKFYGNGNFFLYSKFQIAYLHLVWVALFGYLYENKKKRVLLIHWTFAMWMCMYANCSTGILGLIVMFTLYMFNRTIYKLICRPVIAIVAFMGCSAMIILHDLLLNNSIVQFIIINILNRSLNLTNRIYIYDVIDSILQVQPFWGVGAENNYKACQYYMRLSIGGAAPNVQNGILDIMVSYGLIGMLLLIFLLFTVLHKGAGKNNSSILIIIYAYFVMASGEIVFDKIFFLLLAVYAYADKRGGDINYIDLRENSNL